MLGHLGAILGLCWAVLGQLGARLGLCWAILGPSWAYVGPMLAQACPYLSLMLTHVANICAEDVECHRAKKHCKLQGFLSTRSPTAGRRLGAQASVTFGYHRRPPAMPRARGRRPDLRADAPRRLRRISRPSISSQCGLESFWMGTCFRHIFLMFFEKRSWNRNFVGNRRLFWGASEFPKAPAKGFSRRTAANFNLLLRVKAPLCKDFSV